MKLTYNHTRRACFTGYFIQALVCNLAPLLFVTFQNKFGITLAELSYLILFNFLCQLLADIFGTRFGDKLGYRRMAILCPGLSFVGFLLMAVLPNVMGNVFLALILSTLVFAFGGGLSEVMLNSVMDAIPKKESGSTMALLHSFFSWGQVGTVVLSSLFLKLFGEDVWYLLPAIWSLLPLYNLICFARVPMPEAVPAEERTPLRSLFKKRSFLLMVVIMLSAGASEMAMAQWASFFAERGLGVSKFVGDLLGPCAFAVLMGGGRLLYGFFGSKWKFCRVLPLMAVLCIVCYFTSAVATNPVWALIGCAMCGFSVSLMWPGTLAVAADRYPTGGTSMFGMLAIAGDIGCSVGPWLSGLVSDGVQRLPQGLTLAADIGITPEQLGLKAGLLICCLFPFILLIAELVLTKRKSALK